jgi:hypothetical protein
VIRRSWTADGVRRLMRKRVRLTGIDTAGATAYVTADLAPIMQNAALCVNCCKREPRWRCNEP